MERQLNIGFLTTYSGQWPQEIPNQRDREYGDWLETNLPKLHVVRVDVLGYGEAEVTTITRQFKEAEVDVIMVVYGAFTGDDISTCLGEMLKIPIILWASYEVPFQGDDRLYSNTLYAMTMSSAALRRAGVKYHTVYGNWNDRRAARKVKSLLMAYHTVKCLKHTQLGPLSYRPTVFYNCAFNESLIRRAFGVKIEETDLKVMFNKIDALLKEAYEADMAKMEQEFDTNRVPKGHLENRSKPYLVLKDVMMEQGYDLGTLKCWPEMGNLHTTPCVVLGRLADEGISIGCEDDVDAELAQMAEFYLTGQPSFITDMVNIDEKENVMTFQHYGNAMPSLCNPKYPVSVCNHPLAGRRATFYKALKPGKVTATGFCNLDREYKLFLLWGETVDMDRYTRGIMANIRVEKPVREIIERIIEERVPHHYSLIQADVTDELKEVCGLLGIRVVETQDLRAAWQSWLSENIRRNNHMKWKGTFNSCLGKG